MFKRVIAVFLCFLFIAAVAVIPCTVTQAMTTSDYINRYQANYPAYLKQEQPIVDAFRANYNNSPAQALVERAVWYMENGYMIYGHTKYATTGYIDCSNFVSLVYKDFGYSITSAARNYNTVGKAVTGVQSAHVTGSTTKYKLVGIDKLRPGDIITFWKEDSSGNRYIGHVALYMGNINGKPTIIQTVSGRPTAIGITDSFTYWYGEHFNSVRRVLPDSAMIANGPRTQKAPVIPLVYVLPPQKPVVLPGTTTVNTPAPSVPVTNTPVTNTEPVNNTQPTNETNIRGTINCHDIFQSTTYF